MKDQITVYSYNPATFEYLGESFANKDPLETPTRYLIPASATDIQPIFEEGKITKWNGSGWTLEIPEPEPDPEPTPLPSLADEKLNKIRQLALNRNRLAEQDVVEHNGKTYSNSQNARTAILGMLSLMTASSPAQFYLTYPVKESVLLTRSDFQSLRDKIILKESMLRQKEFEITNQLNATKTLDELEAVNISLDNL